MNEYVTVALTPEYEVGFNTAWDRLRLTTHELEPRCDCGCVSIETWLTPRDARTLAGALMDAAYRFDGNIGE